MLLDMIWSNQISFIFVFRIFTIIWFFIYWWNRHVIQWRDHYRAYMIREMLMRLLQYHTLFGFFVGSNFNVSYCAKIIKYYMKYGYSQYAMVKVFCQKKKLCLMLWTIFGYEMDMTRSRSQFEPLPFQLERDFNSW